VAGNQIVDLRGSAMSVTKDKPSEAFKNFDKSSSSESGGAAVVPRRKARTTTSTVSVVFSENLAHAEFLHHQIVQKLRGYA
jgi:hypothetical protein